MLPRHTPSSPRMPPPLELSPRPVPLPERSSPSPMPGFEKGRWCVFPDSVVATFKAVPMAELAIESTSVDFVVNTLMQPRWWESEEKYGSTRISLIQKQRLGRVLYLRSVKTSVGPAKFRLRLWTTQWAEQLGDGKAVVNLHCFDDHEKCHLVSRFICTPTQDHKSVMVRYEEATSSPKIAVKIAQNKIKKAHVYVLQLVAAQVAKNAHLLENAHPVDPIIPYTSAVDKDSAFHLNSNAANNNASQRSNTDAMMEATTTGADVTDDEELFQDEEDELIELTPWDQLPLDSVRAQIMDPVAGVLVSSRQWRMRTYKNVFVGNEAVDWLVERFPISRDGSVALLRELQQQGWLSHVKGDHDFKDDHLFFVWRDPSKQQQALVEMESDDSLQSARGSSRSTLSAAAPAAAGPVAVAPAVAPPAPVAAAPSASLLESPVRLRADASLRERFEDLSLDGKLLGACFVALLATHSLGWTTLFFLISIGASFLAFRVGKTTVDDELRSVKRKLFDMERRLTVAVQARDGGVAGAAAEAPVVVIEPDRDIKKLLQKNKALVDEARRVLGPEIDPAVHDDIYLLRFVLSFKEIDAIVDAVRKCIAWRAENAELLKMVERNEQLPCRAVISKYAVSDYHSKPLADGSPLLITRAGLCDLSALLAHVSQRELVDWLMWLNESAHRECDRITRATGRLTKVIRVNDMAGASLMQDRGFFSAVGKSSKLAAFVWPQFVEKNIILNPPSLMSMLLKVAATFLSPSTMSKVALCRGNTLRGSIDDCPFASRRFHRADLPTFMGGDCTHDGHGCVENVPNHIRDMSWQQQREAEPPADAQ